MTEAIIIDGRSVMFKANALTAVKYQDNCGRDLFEDIAKWQKAAQNGEVFSTKILQSFLRFAHTLAKQADKSVPENEDDWLDQFDAFPIDEIMPKLIDLWLRSTVSTAKLKKKAKA